MMLSVQAEALINEGGMIPCYEIVSITWDQLNGWLKTIAKFGAPAEKDTTTRTLIYASPRM